MTYAELSDAMDTLSNRYAQTKNVSLVVFDEYEKSLFLTKAANEIVKEMMPEYDRNEKVKKQLLPITKSTQVSTIFSADVTKLLRKDSIVYELPSDVMYVVAESVRDTNNVILRRIKPLKDDEAYYSFDNPFRASTRGYAWRDSITLVDGGVTKKYSEIITDVLASTNPRYYLKYISKIPPFIVTDSLEDASIDGVSTNADLTQSAPLDLLHEKILDRAIMIGYMSKTDDPNSKVTASNLSINS
jgi:hypothetical protein